MSGDRSPWRLVIAAALLAVPRPAFAAPDWNRALVEVRDLSSLSLAPAGDRLLFRVDHAEVASDSERLGWMLLDTRTGAIRNLGSAGTALFDDPGVLREESPLWMANGDAVVRYADGEVIGAWRYRPGDSRWRPFIVDDANLLAIRPGGTDATLDYELGPTRAAVQAAEEEERAGGVLVDQRVDLAQGLFRSGRVDGRMATQRLSGYWFMRGGLLDGSPRSWRRRDVSNGTDQLLVAPAAPPPFVPPALDQVARLAGPDGADIVAHWTGRTGQIEWRAPDAGTVSCAAPACHELRASWLAWRVPGRELLLGLSDRFHRTTLAMWPRGQGLRKLVTVDGLAGGSRRFPVPCAAGPSTAYCVVAGPASPPRLVAIDLATGRSRTLFDPNNDLRKAYKPHVARLSLTLGGGAAGRPGLPVAATILTQGPRGGARPFFVNYYRCDGFLRGGEGDEWPLAALLDGGFGVACLNSAPLDGPQNAIRTYEIGMQAVGQLVDQLATKGLLDRARVAMGGFSFGSEVTMWTAMKSHLLAAASIASAQVEPTDYGYGSILGPAHDKVMRDVWGLGDPDWDAAAWQKVSPAKNADRIRIPILLQLPEQEARRIPELFVRLRQEGTPVEFWAYPGEDHLKVEPRHHLAVYQHNLDWFRYWLQGWRDPDPAKAAQYARWDAMDQRRSAP